MSAEKRKYKRIKSDFNVRVKDVAPGFNITGMSTAKSINISATGVLFQHDRPIELGCIVNLKFLKPNSFDFFDGNARVVRVESGVEEGVFEIGVQFVGLVESDEKKLAYYLTTDEE